MNKYHDDFIEAINNKDVVSVTVNSQEKGMIKRKCIPFDFGPSRRYKDGKERYHFYDLDSPDGSHNLSILPEQLMDLSILGEHFEPGEYVTWTPKWYVSRDWGEFS